MKYEEFECIYQEYYLKILTFIHKRVPDLYEAEELTGDVFLSFYRNMDSYDEEKGSIATWLYAITANRLKNYYRDKKTHYSLEILKQQTIPREKMPEEIVAKIMREETLRKSLEQLSDREREILLGRFYYQKSSTELGRQMNLSPGNVRMIQKRALEKLRMIMEKQAITLLILKLQLIFLKSHILVPVMRILTKNIIWIWMPLYPIFEKH